jgi:Na+/H+ antiporter NhaC
MGLIGDSFQKLGIDKNVYITFIQSIPYRFYCLLALLTVPMLAIFNRDLQPMLSAEKRARSTGQVIRPGGKPMSEDIGAKYQVQASNIWNGLLPILTVIVITGVGLYWSGIQKVGKAPLYQIIGSADSFAVLMWAAFAGAILAVILAIANSPLKFGDTIDAFIDGVKSMVLAIIILILAWSLGKICEDLGTAQFVAGAVRGAIPPWMLPALTFVISASISFATGTSWGTMAILVPIVIPVAFNLIVPLEFHGTMEAMKILNAHWHLMLSAIGSVLAGSVFGDHCSPISDTTIMSSMTSASDHIDHVKTQMPYAILAAIVGTIIGDLPAGMGLNPFISLAVSLVIVYLFLRVFGGKVEE